MRQIKFRGKRIDNGEWVYGQYTCDAHSRHYITQPLIDSHQLIQVIPETVGQYTGGKDASGNDPYEDDIFEDDAVAYKIIWCESMLCWDCIEISSGDNMNLSEFDRSSTCFKQGNTFDNPNLITE